MSDEGFEKGLKLLLNNAYDRPEPDENFRNQLLERLRGKQSQTRAVRRRRVLTLYSACTTAAAAAVVIGFVPFSALTQYPAGGQASGTITAQAPQPEATNLTTSQFVTPSRTPDLRKLFLENTRSGSELPGAITVSNHSSAPSALSDNTDRIPASSVPTAPLLTLAGTQAQALNAIDIRNENATDWTALKPGSTFKLQKGMQIRTPVGMVDPTTIAIGNSTMLMLDGMSRINVGEQSLQLQDGRAVLSLSNSRSAVGMQLAEQELALQPGTMAFLRVEDNEDYAHNGAPAPVLVLLKGTALPITESGQVREGSNVLTAQKVYELYNTGTGRYPSRALGSYESQQRFQPMINAIATAHEFD